MEMEDYMNRLSTFTKPDLENVKEITSAEYFYDPDCHLSTHEHLVNDHLIMNTYKGWIEDNAHLFRGKTVLDVGCGTGVFSMLAAKAGAARVISIEWSSIAKCTIQAIKDNKFDRTIKVINSKVEHIRKLPDEIKSVDVIISMWIGYSLLQGGRLKQVILARDKWLKKNGHIIPDMAQLFITGISDDEFRETKIDWWKNVYGYDMSCVTDDFLKYANYCIVSPKQIITNKCLIKDIDLKNVTYSQITESQRFNITVTQNDYVQGFCTFFKIRFSDDTMTREINTSPTLDSTHWGQCCFYLKDYFMVKKKEKIQGNLALFHINKDPRFLGIVIGFLFEGKMSSVSKVCNYILRP